MNRKPHYPLDEKSETLYPEHPWFYPAHAQVDRPAAQHACTTRPRRQAGSVLCFVSLICYQVFGNLIGSYGNRLIGIRGRQDRLAVYDIPCSLGRQDNYSVPAVCFLSDFVNRWI